MKRRRFLATTLATSLAGAYASGCHHGPTKEQVLRSLADEVLAPGVRGAVDASHNLRTAVSNLAASPSARTVEQACAAWVDAAVRFKRANAFRDQTLSTSSELVRAAFWPPRPRAIDELVRSDAPLNDDDIEKLGADVRSLYAMEYLLFPAHSGSPFALDTADHARVRQLLVAFSGNVSRRAELAKTELGATPVVSRLASEGQDAVNRLVGLTVGNVEHFVANRLATIVWIASTKRSRAIDVEGGPSGISHKLGAAVMEVTARLYEGEQGPGLGALVAAVAPAVHDRVRADFSAAVTAIHGFAEPLEAVALADRPRLDALLAKLKTLEVALRSDLASALGVTLTFSSADAD